MINNIIEDICRKLKPFLGRKADALWLSYVTAENPITRNETEAIIRLMSIKYLKNKPDDVSIYLAPPMKHEAQGEFPIGIIYYGDTALYPLNLKRDNFMKHIGIFAITGAGKSNVAQVLLLNLLKKKIPFLVLDWKRGYRALHTLPSKDVKKIKVLTLGRKTESSFSWNPLRGPPNVHPQTWISIVAESLEKSHISGQGVADIFINAVDKLFEDSGVYDGTVTKFPNFFDAKEELERVQYRGRKSLWQDSCLRILRTFSFGPAAGAFNSRNPIEFEHLLDDYVIIELDQELPKPLRTFFSEIILRWLHLYRLGQGETDQLRHVTFLEEVHNLFPKSNIEKQSSNSLEYVFREIRGFGEGLVNITQHPSLLPIYILGNCNTQIYLGLQHEDDIITAKKSLFLEDEIRILDNLKVGEGVIKIKNRVNPCYVKFPLIPIKKGVITDEMISGGSHNREKNMD